MCCSPSIRHLDRALLRPQFGYQRGLHGHFIELIKKTTYSIWVHLDLGRRAASINKSESFHRLFDNSRVACVMSICQAPTPKEITPSLDINALASAFLPSFPILFPSRLNAISNSLLNFRINAYEKFVREEFFCNACARSPAPSSPIWLPPRLKRTFHRVVSHLSPNLH